MKKIVFTIFLFDKKREEDLGIELDEIEAKSTIRIQDISGVRETAKEEKELNRCVIEMVGGQNFLVKGSYDDVIKKLSENGW